MTLDRRDFLLASAGAAGALDFVAESRAAESRAAGRGAPFTLDYAPHFDMFAQSAGRDLVDQIAFMADQGFRSLEDNWMANRSPAEQEKIRAALDKHGMRMGVFVAHAEFGKPTFTSADPAARERITADIKRAVEVAERVGAKWCTVVPGAYERNREWDYQTANVIDNLRRAAELCEPSGLVMVLEPLNWWSDHGGVFLHKTAQAFLICRAVDSPSCKILFDIYHQQISEGHLIRNIDQAWNEIAYFQIGDNPGRCEPGTGEIHYANLLRHIHAKGYTGILGMEHGNSKPGKEGEAAVIAAY